MRLIFRKLTEIIFKNKLIFLLIWITVISVSLFSLLGADKENNEIELSGANNTDAAKLESILINDFKIKSGNSAAIVINKKVNTNLLVSELKNKFPQIDNISNVKSEESHNYQLLYIDFKQKYLFVEVQSLTKEIRNFFNQYQKKDNTKIYLTGNSAFYYDMKDSGKKDSAKGEIFALFCSLIILIFNFGALVSALIPILIGASTIIISNAIIKIFSIQIIPISQVMSGLVGLALSIDYSLFIVNRFREELKKENIIQDGYQALVTSMINSGKTILISALIMICSVSVLLIPDVSSSKIVVKNLLIVIIISFINSIIFLPVFLIYTKNLLDKPKFIAKYLKNSDNYLIWRKFASHVVEYPKRYFILSLSVLLLFALPVYNIKLWEPSQTLAPSDSESMQGYKLLEKDNWGGELIPIEIAIKSSEIIYTKDLISFVYDFTKYLENNPNVSSVQSITSWNKKFSKNDYFTLYNSLYPLGLISQNTQIQNMVNINTGENITLVKVFQKSLMDIESSHKIIKYAKEFNKNNKYQIYVGGMTARAKDFTNELYNYMPQMFFIIFVSIYILLFFYMKSAILPIKAGIMNFLPILSSYGIIVLIFQYGYFHQILNTPINHAVTAMVPLTLFCIVFGLSMDYEVLILSRISECYEQTNDVKEAVIEGLARSGSVITGAALIMLVVFIPGIFSTSPGIKEICIGIIAAIFIDSTIVRLFLVPSFVILMGKWNWWTPFKSKK